MMQRILVLTSYLLRRLFFSLAGLIYAILALLYWAIFFPPGQGTPDAENYILIIAAFGAAISFLITLTITARANQAVNYPLLVRLPSRVEYLAAVLISAIVAATALQLVVALLALYNGPSMSIGRALEIPPVWLSPNILAAVLALHASDFVTKGWSRVYVYGILAIFLFGQSAGDNIAPWLGDRFSRLSSLLMSRGWEDMGASLFRVTNWLNGDGVQTISNLFSFIFWPFRAVVAAVSNGFFDPTQALAPAVILLYATILFLLAADLFATKDVDFTE